MGKAITKAKEIAAEAAQAAEKTEGGKLSPRQKKRPQRPKTRPQRQR